MRNAAVNVACGVVASAVFFALCAAWDAFLKPMYELDWASFVAFAASVAVAGCSVGVALGWWARGRKAEGEAAGAAEDAERKMAELEGRPTREEFEAMKAELESKAARIEAEAAERREKFEKSVAIDGFSKSQLDVILTAYANGETAGADLVVGRETPIINSLVDEGVIAYSGTLSDGRLAYTLTKKWRAVVAKRHGEMLSRLKSEWSR